MKLFICHASEDKEEVARPLAEALSNSGVNVWYDEYSLSLGDSLRREIERGLVECDYGVVILSPDFFHKEWTQRELDSLTAREVSEKRKFILPIWHKIDAKFLARKSPNLADKIAISTEKGIDEVATAIAVAVNSSVPKVPEMTSEELSEAHDIAELIYMRSLAKAELDEDQNISSENQDGQSKPANPFPNANWLKKECPQCGKMGQTVGYEGNDGDEFAWFECSHCGFWEPIA